MSSSAWRRVELVGVVRLVDVRRARRARRPGRRGGRRLVGRSAGSSRRRRWRAPARRRPCGATSGWPTTACRRTASALRSRSAVSRSSRIGSSSTLRISVWKPVVIFLNSPYALPGLAHRVGQLLRAEHDEGDEQQEDDLAPGQVEHAGESTRSRPSRGATCVDSCHHGPACSSAFRRCSTTRSRSPTVARRAHAPENTLEAFALGLAPRRHRAGERRVADRRRRPGARPRRRGAAAGSPPPADRQLRRARAARRTSRPSPTCSSAAAATTTCRSTSRTAAAGTAVIEVVRAPRPGAARPACGCAHRDLADAAAAPRPRRRQAGRLDPAGPDQGGPGAPGRRPRGRGHRRDQHAPHRLERRAGRPCSTASSGSRSAGTCSSSTCCGPPCGWASTASTATGSTDGRRLPRRARRRRSRRRRGRLQPLPVAAAAR